jgi:hypothetical protein
MDGEFDRPAVDLEDEYPQIAESRYRDAAAGRTLDGPHRADLLVRHRDKRMDAARCSTGEQKALLVGLDPGACPPGRQSHRPRADPAARRDRRPSRRIQARRAVRSHRCARRPGLHDRHGPVDVFSTRRPGAVIHRCRKANDRHFPRVPRVASIEQWNR